MFEPNELKTSNIPRELAEVSERTPLTEQAELLEQLTKSVAELGERLSPYLLPHLLEKKTDANHAVPVENRSDLYSRIHDNNRHIWEIHTTITDLNHRLDRL